MADLTIDELARETGMTVRNIRSYQTRGLLPGPQMRGRVAYYGAEHIERLALIQELQADGLSLQLVERLVAERADATGRLVALRRGVLLSLQTDVPETLTRETLVERFGDYDGAVIERALALGTIVEQPDGRFLVPRPAVLGIGEEVMGQGVSVQHALDVVEVTQRACEAAAQAFVGMVMKDVWVPFDAAGRPEEQWPEIAETIERLRPLGSELMMAMLPPLIAAEVERAFGAAIRAQAKDD
jgi:DNA-binding transcriptional MerR regulator